jgi:hypothetical protein
VWEIAEPDKNKVSHFSEEFSKPICYNCTGGMQDQTQIFSLNKPGKTSLTFTYFEEKITINFIVH